jgi:polysaccharide export outer membrane protein
MPSTLPVRSSLALALLATACAGTVGDYVWVDAYPSPPRRDDSEYVLAPGDQISVRVYNQEAMSGRARVRADGRISLPLVNDVQAAGLTPSALSASIQKRLKDFIVNPTVTVSLEESRPFDVFVVGEVARPGRYALDPNATVLQAIAAAGGLTQYATRDRVFVVREDPGPVRIRFRYDSLTRIEGKAASFRLRNGDTVVAE